MTALVLGFNVKADKKVQLQARVDNVDMKFYKVIYHLLDEVKEQLSKLLPPVLEKHVTGEATILQIFQINVKNKEFKSVAGCRVTNGTIFRNQKVRILRNNNQIWEGKKYLFSSLYLINLLIYFIYSYKAPWKH
jgi:translation initiation factor IF-2